MQKPGTVANKCAFCGCAIDDHTFKVQREDGPVVPKGKQRPLCPVVKP